MAGVGNRGFTLLEMAVVLAVLASIATAAIPYFIRQAEIAAANKTAKEISTIQEASKWYYVSNKAWPPSVDTLKSTGFLNPSWAGTNPWGNTYFISSIGTSLTVTTYVPDSVGGVLTRALPGVSSSTSGSNRSISSVIPVPGQEASLTEVTGLANTALSRANSAQSAANNAQNTADTALSKANQSALPPYGHIITETGSLCPAGYVMIGMDGTRPIQRHCKRVTR